jgi:hypothetical protein
MTSVSQLHVDNRLTIEYKSDIIARKQALIASMHILDDIRSVYKNELTGAINRGLKEKNFDSPGWDKRRAYLDGVAAGLQLAINLLPYIDD